MEKQEDMALGKVLKSGKSWREDWWCENMNEVYVVNI